VEIQEYLAVLRKRWVTVVALAVLTVGVGVGVTVRTTAQYQATTQVFVSVQGGSTTSDMLQGANFTRQQVTSYAKLVTSPLVLGPAIEKLGLGVRPEALSGRVSAESPLNTALINITVTDGQPAMAAALADEIAAQFTQVITDLETPASGGTSAVKISVVRDAVVPSSQSSPNVKLNLALGLLVGLGLGVGIAVLREVLDTRVRDEVDVAKVTATSVIGVIGYDQDTPKHPLIVQDGTHGHRSEAFRRLRTNLQFLDIADRPKSIVVTSSMSGEGKTTTVINLAISLADAGSRVALIDADLRRPSVAKVMGLEGAVGLTTVLIGRASVEEAIQPWGGGYLHVLPSGLIPPNPSELLGSQAMAYLLDRLTDDYDIVLVDAAPLLPVTDAAILSKLTGGALVVVGASEVNRNQLAGSIGALETVGARVLGIVLNKQARKQGDTYAYYDYTPHDTEAGHMPRIRHSSRPTHGPEATQPVPDQNTTDSEPPASDDAASDDASSVGAGDMRPGRTPTGQLTQADQVRR